MSDTVWSDVIVPSKLEPEEQWQRNGEYVYRDEAEEKLTGLRARLRVSESDCIAYSKEMHLLEARLQAAEAALRTYGSHLGNCGLDSWSANLDSCDCRLFNLLAAHGTEVQA